MWVIDMMVVIRCVSDNPSQLQSHRTQTPDSRFITQNRLSQGFTRPPNSVVNLLRFSITARAESRLKFSDVRRASALLGLSSAPAVRGLTGRLVAVTVTVEAVFIDGVIVAEPNSDSCELGYDFSV
ncbi:hypothetical protein E1B28_009711 [Marasmius oreades]|uniref:Uncharacterized protein n=1 Tax=Marasmius oreades TaxID=181124 RepID=A0A9P7RVM0_9AGAR|nr:uncharacterized protein E1B28_009711 [Marasmius oreades]KAG7090609.1 hypothetical protein E1B28_009711 [Marasmius oreades]